MLTMHKYTFLYICVEVYVWYVLRKLIKNLKVQTKLKSKRCSAHELNHKKLK